MTPLSVTVVVGGPSAEANVSRASGAEVAGALTAAGHRVTTLELEPRALSALLADRPDVVFPITHGPLGEDGCLQGLLEVLALPFVGSGVLASALAASKPHAKALFRAAGLPLAEGALVGHGEDLPGRAREVRGALGRAVVVKPSSGGSAVATTRLSEDADDAALERALAAALAVDSAALVEQFVVGHEVTCGVLDVDDAGPLALPPTLIESRGSDFYDFRARYGAGKSEHFCPAPFAEALSLSIQAIAVAAHRALGCRDLSRADFIVTPEGSVTLLEVNTLPGMTATSLFPEAARVHGLGFTELCDALVNRAHRRPVLLRPQALAMP